MAAPLHACSRQISRDYVFDRLVLFYTIKLEEETQRDVRRNHTSLD